MTDMIPRAEADALVAAVIDWYDGLVGSSTGVAGYHVNGAVAGWGEFDRPTCPDDARATLEAMLAEARQQERALALDEVSEQWAAAVYGMTENGVAALNEQAARDLHPEITAFSVWLSNAAIRAEAGD